MVRKCQKRTRDKIAKAKVALSKIVCKTCLSFLFLFQSTTDITSRFISVTFVQFSERLPDHDYRRKGKGRSVPIVVDARYARFGICQRRISGLADLRQSRTDDRATIQVGDTGIQVRLNQLLGLLFPFIIYYFIIIYQFII